MFVKLMFFAIETHSCTGAHAHTHTRAEKGKWGKIEERGEIQTAPMYQYKSTGVQFYTFLYLFPSRVVALRLIISDASSQVSLSWRDDNKHMASLVGFVFEGPALSRKPMNAIKIAFQITQRRALEGAPSLSARSVSSSAEGFCLKTLNGTPLGSSERERQRKKSQHISPIRF